MRNIKPQSTNRLKLFKPSATRLEYYFRYSQSVQTLMSPPTLMISPTLMFPITSCVESYGRKLYITNLILWVAMKLQSESELTSINYISELALTTEVMCKINTGNSSSSFSYFIHVYKIICDELFTEKLDFVCTCMAERPRG